MCFASPFHFLWNGVHLLLAPGASHSGYEDHFQADAFHYMHHKYFECNYAGLGAAALDVMFGTFMANFHEAAKDEKVVQPADAKSKFIVGLTEDNQPVVYLPSAEWVVYMAGSGACLGAWAWAAGCVPGAPPFPVPLGAEAKWAVSLAAGFGPVAVAQLMGFFNRDGASLFAPGKFWASAFHVAVGTVFCSVPVTWACHMALV